MKFNSQVRYGMRAMVEIAKSDQEKRIFQKDISVIQKISNKYLDHIIYSLKRAGLLVNIKGKKSKYRLTREASNITTLDIYKAFEPEIAIIECLSKYVQCDGIRFFFELGMCVKLTNIPIQINLIKDT